MLHVVWAALFLTFNAAKPPALVGDEWRAVSQPTESEARCAVYRPDNVVAIRAGQLVVTASRGPRRDALPFKLPSDVDDGTSPRQVRKIPGGWLVGIDRGEWVGGLYRTNDDGTEIERVQWPEDARLPLDAGENVFAFGGDEENVLILGGAHMLEAAWVLLMRADAYGWRVSVVGRLEGAATASTQLDGNLIAATRDGLWIATPEGQLTRLLRRRSGHLSPTSVVAFSETVFLIGFRHYISRVTVEGGRAREAWFATAKCRDMTQ